MNVSILRPRPVAQSCLDCAARDFAVCGALESSELHELAKLSRHVRLASGAALLVEANRAESFFSLVEGTLRLYKLLPDGRRQIVGFALPGDFIGLSDTQQYEVSADAVGPVVLCQFPRSAFARFAAGRPHLLRRIAELAGRELGRAQEHMVLLGRKSAEEKVICFLIGWRDRLNEIGRTQELVSLPMGRLDIADHLGLTIETVSRTLSKLERESVIRISTGGVHVVDLERARKLAASGA